MSSVFLSHNHNDKPFVRKLAKDLETHGIRVWLDEAEMKVGDSLIAKIRTGIDEVDFFAVILSPNSINAPWVVNELDVAMNLQLNGKAIKILPLMYKACDLPGFLPGKFYADFRNESDYERSFGLLINSMDIVFNRNIFSGDSSAKNLGRAIDKAIYRNLPLMSKPFHRPFQYVGMPVSEVLAIVNGSENEAGNITVENDECAMFLEAEGAFISYVDIDIKRTAPHKQDQEFDSEAILGAFSIGISDLELVRKQIHFHTYYDHRRKLKIGVSCLYDGAPINISFSAKNYGL
ncbi:toll/interleukin-1 receptor domain-containing protein [Pseudomonas congelans]|uniref:toll/interleukin-1 receptor domain-containing protein n=1 Tax=Pseudomonas congelans TaxID=200452 RepID=UPI001EFC6C07|nr:toll/interleukin-1 receptor domain-containing protein [Pseudomonas congelans]